MKRTTNRRNTHINPILYDFYLHLKQNLGAKMVHRRSRKSNDCIEIVYYNPLYTSFTGRLNTLKEAEACGYWIMCRAQRKGKHALYHNKPVFQLFLTPVHPKKQYAARIIARQVTFEPVNTRQMQHSRPKTLRRGHRGGIVWSSSMQCGSKMQHFQNDL